MKPHDTLFRIITTDEEVQQDLIRIAIPDLAPQIQMSSVRAVPDTFTKGAQADLLLTARENNGTHHLIYILVEHKSYADRNVAVQLWGYVAAIWKRWIEHEKSDRSTVHGGSMQEVLIGYLTRQTPEENKDVLLEVTSKMLYDTEGGKRAMTMAEALFKEGQEAGLKIGQEAGLKEGQKAGLRSVARSLLREGLDQELVQRVTGLPAEQIEALAPDTDEA